MRQVKVSGTFVKKNDRSQTVEVQNRSAIERQGKYGGKEYFIPATVKPGLAVGQFADKWFLPTQETAIEENDGEPIDYAAWMNRFAEVYSQS